MYALKHTIRKKLGGDADVSVWKKRLNLFLSKNWVVLIAVITAVITCFFVPPDKEYLKYPSYKTLLCLLSLMLVLRGVKDSKFFSMLSGKILDRISDRRAIVLTLVFLPSLVALFVTNDVATLTFVPFAIILLTLAESKDLIPRVILLQMMAVKLSGLLSPLGSAQNLFLIDYYDFDFLWFAQNLWPLAIAGYGLTFILCLSVGKGKIDTVTIGTHKLPKWHITAYFVMFVFILLAVFDVLPYYIVTPIIMALMLFLHPRSYKKANYSIIVMFLAFFIISGNFMRMPAVSNFLMSFLAGKEYPLSIAASQLLTNTPVALLFPRFSSDTVALMYGINVGKFGTSMLSNFIVYRLYRKYDEKHDFIWKLLGINFLFLALLGSVGALYLYL